MKAMFEFNLPEELDNYNIYRQAPTYNSVLYDISNYLRSLYKYRDDLTAEQEQLVEEIRTKFYEIIKENELEDGCI